MVSRAPRITGMRILFVASDRMEFPGFLRRATAVRPTDLAADWSRKVLLNGNEALLVANGVGPERARAAAEAGIGGFAPDVIVSTGFCGALSPALGIADLVAANRIVTGGQIYAAHPLKGPLCGPIRSISFVAHTAQEKRELASEGAIAVEMEAAGVAAEALRHSIPFSCVRAVTDLAGESLANDFNKALRSDGHFDTMSILRVALLHPATRLPELIRLRKRCVLAARALGDFFADNKF
jgi:adenosylhomocysteine nucleosidase